MIEIQFNMKNSILLAFLATDFCSGLQLFRLDNTFLLAFIAPSNFLTETISMRVTHITGLAHNVTYTIHVIITFICINFPLNTLLFNLPLPA